ncbi:MAG: hypothetical protein ABMA64_39315, partial [Myxococcota bacterium]
MGQSPRLQPGLGDLREAVARGPVDDELTWASTLDRHGVGGAGPDGLAVDAPGPESLATRRKALLAGAPAPATVAATPGSPAPTEVIPAGPEPQW